MLEYMAADPTSDETRITTVLRLATLNITERLKFYINIHNIRSPFFLSPRRRGITSSPVVFGFNKAVATL